MTQRHIRILAAWVWCIAAGIAIGVEIIVAMSLVGLHS